MDNLIDCLNDISKVNVIYTTILLASFNNIRLDTSNLEALIAIMSLNTTDATMHDSINNATYITWVDGQQNPNKPSLLYRTAKRLALLSDNFIVYLENQFNEHTASSIASLSVLIIVLSIICCFIMSLIREEERKIKEQYKKLNSGSSQSFIAIDGHSGYQKIGSQQRHNIEHDSRTTNAYKDFNGLPSSFTAGANISSASSFASSAFQSKADSQKLHLIELRRETYFGLVRLSKPGCRTIVLLCDTQSKIKLLTKFHQYIYPYRKNKTIQFAYLLIEKNISWYKDLLKLALSEKRDLHINPINCIGTVLVLNGFKKYFSVYHASDSRCDPDDEPFILFEESLLDNLPRWLERLFSGKASRYYVKYWPDQMR